MGSRKPEVIIGLIGSIIAIGVGIWIISYGDSLSAYIQTFTYLPGNLGGEVAQLGWITLIVGIVALLSVVFIKKAPRGFGILLTLIGILMFFLLGTLWIVSGVLLTLTGLMGIFRQPLPDKRFRQ
ncbi:DUF4064 domain-containing protein [Listeria ilorinensis]|uniref:DUF4064 domain-containing protein n=1 Tax=Listeria ilorinensis TaxID=2867439 RepID=UPI001EF619AC|nr:DUF4064 domain-containing protein [Listeria ilorinensis]